LACSNDDSAEEYEGRGIGLALCKAVITRHGGTIRAEAAPGNGAAFYFTLPKGDEQQAKHLDTTDHHDDVTRGKATIY
jgi:light-regulated signal transduction histidine kinase (bacteriophytochrome)